MAIDSGVAFDAVMSEFCQWFNTRHKYSAGDPWRDAAIQIVGVHNRPGACVYRYRPSHFAAYTERLIVLCKEESDDTTGIELVYRPIADNLHFYFDIGEPTFWDDIIEHVKEFMERPYKKVL